jgi:hypothetical protein
MIVRMGIRVIVPMTYLGCRNDVKVVEPNAALRSHRVRKCLYVADASLQHGDLQAVALADMKMQGGDGKVMVMMLGARQPLREVAGLVVVNIA